MNVRQFAKVKKKKFIFPSLTTILVLQEFIDSVNSVTYLPLECVIRSVQKFSGG
jgi:hypothetical protein